MRCPGIESFWQNLHSIKRNRCCKSRVHSASSSVVRPKLMLTFITKTLDLQLSEREQEVLSAKTPLAGGKTRMGGARELARSDSPRHGANDPSGARSPSLCSSPRPCACTLLMHSTHAQRGHTFEACLLGSSAPLSRSLKPSRSAPSHTTLTL
jgi:hypothetical protein